VESTPWSPARPEALAKEQGVPHAQMEQDFIAQHRPR
jgi:hypothetical protein